MTEATSGEESSRKCKARRYRRINAAQAYEVFETEALGVVSEVVKKLPETYYGKDVLIEPVSLSLNEYRDDISTGTGHWWKPFYSVEGEFEAGGHAPMKSISFYYYTTTAYTEYNYLSALIAQPTELHEMPGLLRRSSIHLRETYRHDYTFHSSCPDREELLTGLKEALINTFKSVEEDVTTVKTIQAPMARKIAELPHFVQKRLVY
ncbi:MAG: hypothetical protein PHW76_09225 [Alphaproteobacteria bacterium]|nr:hypothetical protein [Alphaproteobacteria bacterium]